KTLYVKSLSEVHKLGNFTIKFFAIDHAIMDAVGVILETPVGTVIHPGDWTIEKAPIGRKELEYTQLQHLKKPTILMLESIAAVNNKKQVTEEEMLANLHKLIANAPGRVIVATFSSQIERVKQIMEFAAKTNKKVALDGFSMKLNIEIAQKLGYIKIPKGVIIPIDKTHEYPNNKVVVVCTGAQGEERAALSRIVAGNHRHIQIKKDDTVIFSSSVIPGNERTVQRLRDNLYRLSDYVYHSDMIDVHISGHSNQDGVRKMINDIKPTYFIPVYGNHFMLKEAAKLAYELGYSKDKVLVPDNGSVMKLTKEGFVMLPDKVPSNYV